MGKDKDGEIYFIEFIVIGVKKENKLIGKYLEIYFY